MGFLAYAVLLKDQASAILVPWGQVYASPASTSASAGNHKGIRDIYKDTFSPSVNAWPGIVAGVGYLPYS